MTDFQSLPQEQRRPDARLVGLHAERGDPQARLSAALADLEDADWGLLLAGEAALARQLAALLGPGTLRVDGRLDVDRAAMAAAGLAVADLHGDLAGARAAWLLEPDERILTRARRAGVRVIVDGTLAPGGGWPRRGADYVVYRDGVTLCGHVDAPFAALFGTGEAPQSAAPAPSDLGVALALRDAATLPLRLARAARTVVSLTERLGGAARPAGPTALLLAPDAAPDSLSVPGGVLAATRHVPDGLLLTPGLEDTDAVLARLRSGTAPASTPEPAGRPPVPQGGRTEEPAAGATPEPATDDARAGREGRRPEGRERDERRRFEGRRDEGRRDERRRFEPRRDGNRMGEGRFERRRFESPRADQPGQAQPDTARPDAGRAPDALERFTFESAAAGSAQQAAPQAAPQAQPQASAPAPAEETWEPEIVYSTLEQPPVPLTHTVSSGPDAPDETPAEAHTGEAAEEETAAVP
ncbi:hypothetical protein, partial [uncultured Deinococcus sp.]|uniref:hypothetical protein n=1 Tax=uncultured Deinococcus sp. TaxID=158789 RepID=UPI002586F2B8